MPHYEVGDTITYSPFGGGVRYVLVNNKEDDVKNGLPGFDGELIVDGPTGEYVWGYDNQILDVVRHASAG